MDENASLADFAEKSGVLVSRVAHPVIVEYGDGHINLSPRGTTQPLIRRLLPSRLPAGVTFIAR